jgi:hypothetical protein
VAKAKKTKRQFSVKTFLSTVDGGRTVARYRKNQQIFAQGEPADSVFYIQEGKVKSVSYPSRARRRSSPCMGRETSSARVA